MIVSTASQSEATCATMRICRWEMQVVGRWRARLRDLPGEQISWLILGLGQTGNPRRVSSPAMGVGRASCDFTRLTDDFSLPRHNISIRIFADYAQRRVASQVDSQTGMSGQCCSSSKCYCRTRGNFKNTTASETLRIPEPVLFINFRRGGLGTGASAGCKVSRKCAALWPSTALVRECNLLSYQCYILYKKSSRSLALPFTTYCDSGITCVPAIPSSGVS